MADPAAYSCNGEAHSWLHSWLPSWLYSWLQSWLHSWLQSWLGSLRIWLTVLHDEAQKGVSFRSRCDSRHLNVVYLSEMQISAAQWSFAACFSTGGGASAASQN